MKMFEPATLSAVEATYLAAQSKHPGKTLDNLDLAWSWKLSALAEEFGEVGQMFTYDKISSHERDYETWRNNTVKELLQLAALALAWSESLDHGGQ